MIALLGASTLVRILHSYLAAAAAPSWTAVAGGGVGRPMCEGMFDLNTKKMSRKWERAIASYFYKLIIVAPAPFTLLANASCPWPPPGVAVIAARLAPPQKKHVLLSLSFSVALAQRAREPARRGDLALDEQVAVLSGFGGCI